MFQWIGPPEMLVDRLNPDRCMRIRKYRIEIQGGGDRRAASKELITSANHQRVRVQEYEISVHPEADGGFHVSAPGGRVREIGLHPDYLVRSIHGRLRPRKNFSFCDFVDEQCYGYVLVDPSKERNRNERCLRVQIISVAA